MPRMSNPGNHMRWKGKGKLFEYVGELVVRRQYRKALDFLGRVINNYMPLFGEQEWYKEERRIAWLYRIELLRELGKATEALAWVCLEVELNPDNVVAQALKERIKREAGLLPQKGNVSNPPDDSKMDLAIWDGVAGMRNLKAMLERDVILPLQEPEIYDIYQLSIPNGILLYGPPGCGKTFIARKLAGIVEFTFREIKPGDLSSIYVHGTQGIIAKLFNEAREHSPCMLFFDELDAMVPKRGGNSVGHHYASEVNEFLVQLNDCGKDGILVVGATNLIDRIDPAVLRPGRLDKKFLVAPPDCEARVELLKFYMLNRPQEKINWHQCALELKNYTCAEIEFIVNEAARHALEQKRKIINGDILHAAGKNPPANTEEMIEELRKISNEGTDTLNL